ncbi:unnamed protein product, partial [Polarella glacialis]
SELIGGPREGKAPRFQGLPPLPLASLGPTSPASSLAHLEPLGKEGGARGDAGSAAPAGVSSPEALDAGAEPNCQGSLSSSGVANVRAPATELAEDHEEGHEIKVHRKSTIRRSRNNLGDNRFEEARPGVRRTRSSVRSFRVREYGPSFIRDGAREDRDLLGNQSSRYRSSVSLEPPSWDTPRGDFKSPSYRVPPIPIGKACLEADGTDGSPTLQEPFRISVSEVDERDKEAMCNHTVPSEQSQYGEMLSCVDLVRDPGYRQAPALRLLTRDQPGSLGLGSGGSPDENLKPRPPGSSFKLKRIRCTGARDFPFCTAHCPFLFAVIVLLATVILMIILWPGIDVDADFDNFLKVDSPANTIRTAFLAALPFRGDAKSGASARRLGYDDSSAMKRRLVGVPSGVDRSKLYKVESFSLFYSTSLPNGILDPAVLSKMRDLELSLRNGPLWQHVCREISDRGLDLNCDPGNSFVNLVWPQPVPPQTTEDRLVVPYLLNGKGDSAWPLAAIPSLELFPKLTVFNQAYASTKVKVNFAGDALGTYELWQTLQNDALLSLGSIFFIIIYLAIHSRSLLLSCGSILLTMLSIPAAFVMAASVSGSNVVTGASFLSLFLIAGLGADVVLVFVAFWESSSADCESSDSVSRVRYLYRNAGITCLATSLTTAASFFANLASALSALREFGFFMGLCILMAYGFLLVGLPPLLILNDRLQASASVSGRSFLRLRVLGHKGGSCSSLALRLRSYCDLQRFLTSLCERVLVPFRCPCSLIFPCVVLVFAGWTAAVAKPSGGVPEMFPSGHNLREAPLLNAMFDVKEEVWGFSEAAECDWRRHQSPEDAVRCDLNRCQISILDPLHRLGQPRNISTDIAECTCMPTEQSSTMCFTALTSTTPVALEVRVRFVGLGDVLPGFWTSDAFLEYAAKAAMRANTPELNGIIYNATGLALVQGLATGLAPIFQEYWESGEVFSTSYLYAPLVSIPIYLPANGTRVCIAEEVCYCDAPACQFSGESLMWPILVPTAIWDELKVPDVGSRRLKSGHNPRRGAQAIGPTPSYQRSHAHQPRRLLTSIDVCIVWGLKINGATPLIGKPPLDIWEYNPAFRPDSPSVQRALLAACEDAVAQPDLLISSSACWIADFRSWLLSRGEVFPARATMFSTLLASYRQGRRVLSSGGIADDFLWLDASKQNLKATFVRFQVAVSYTSTPTKEVLAYMEKWNGFLSSLNLDAPGDMGLPWHTSRLWIRAEAEEAILGSTLNTMIVSVTCGFLGTLASTQLDLILSLLVVLIVLGVTVSLAWFMFVVCAWTIGAIEVLGLIVFVGYSITYSLHIAHKYREHISDSSNAGLSARRQREDAVVHSLRSVGGAVIGSAVTTLGSSVFLFF